MKLKEGFVAYNTEDTHILVPTGNQTFKGLVRSNATAGFIMDLLKEETDKESVIKAIMEKYGIDRELAETDAEKVFSQLRAIDALEE